MDIDSSPPFEANVELLRLFLPHRENIVESIEAVLNAQRKPIAYLQDHALLSRHFENCFLARPGITATQRGLEANLKKRIGPRDSALVRFGICTTT